MSLHIDISGFCIIIITIQNDWRLVVCTERFGLFIGNIGLIKEKMRKKEIIRIEAVNQWQNHKKIKLLC